MIDYKAPKVAMFEVHARCPLASRPSEEEIHQVSEPMPYLAACLLQNEWLGIVQGPGWKITIEEVENGSNVD